MFMRPPYMAETDDAPALVGASEVAALLGVSTSRVKQLRKDNADFPPPAVRLNMGDAWWRDDIEAWARANAERRERHDPRKNQPAH